VKSGHPVFVETNAGLKAGFSDEEYEKIGAEIADSAWDHELIVKVKTGVSDPFRENQILMAYLHIEKNQNPELLEILLEKRVVSYAFEEIRDTTGKRLVNLGYEAGIVGIYEGLRVYGTLLEANRHANPFDSLPEIRKTGKRGALNILSELDLEDKINVIIMGAGNVSRGVQESLDQANISPQVLGRKETAHIADYLPNADILVNAVAWYPGEPHIVTKKMLGLMKKTALILDISCDRNGAVQTCVPTKWAKPTYKIKGITHFCIDNLPTAIARETSTRLSSMILPFILKVANKIELGTGQMTKNGVFEFKR
jgi:alanine dehydrogenase